GQLGAQLSLILVDNASEDGTAAWAEASHPGIQVVHNSVNRGFAPAINQGIRLSVTPWIALLNNDAVVAPNWVEELLKVGAGDERIGAVASRMMFQDHPDVVCSAVMEVDASGRAWDWLVGGRRWPTEPTELFGASGGACLLRREML